MDSAGSSASSEANGNEQQRNSSPGPAHESRERTDSESSDK